MRPRPTHERDSIDDDGQILGEHGLHAVLVGRELEDVDPEATDGSDQGQVLRPGQVEVDQVTGGVVRLEKNKSTKTDITGTKKEKPAS